MNADTSETIRIAAPSGRTAVRPYNPSILAIRFTPHPADLCRLFIAQPDAERFGHHDAGCAGQAAGDAVHLADAQRSAAGSDPPGDSFRPADARANQHARAD